MKKTTIFFLLTIFLLAGCATTGSYTMEKHENGSMIMIPISKETKIKQSQLREEGSDVYMTEEYYPLILVALMDRDEKEVLPDVEVKSALNKIEYGDYDVYTLGSDKAENIVLYIHGGAYNYGIDPLHVTLCDKLVDVLNAKVYMPLYPLAPQHQYYEAYEFIDAVYSDLLAEGKKIIIMGDSAGGGFSLAFVEYLKTKGAELPDRMVLLSPWVDIAMENPDIQKYEELDLTLSTFGAVELGKLWAGSLDTKNPLVSPLYGDLSNLPPTLIFTGTDELMYPDNTILYNRMREAGDTVSIVYGEGLWHVFVASSIRESEISMDYIKDFCK